MLAALGLFVCLLIVFPELMHKLGNLGAALIVIVVCAIGAFLVYKLLCCDPDAALTVAVLAAWLAFGWLLGYAIERLVKKVSVFGFSRQPR
jgi:tryptophan-rich sensory protein